MSLDLDSLAPVALWRYEYADLPAQFDVSPLDGETATHAAIPFATYAALVAELRAAREALAFYADDATYQQSHGPECRLTGDPEAPEMQCDSSCGWPEILRDNGVKARLALAATVRP